MDSTAIVLVPVYKADVTSAEHISLKQARRVLGRWAIRIIGPQGLDYSAYKPFDMPVETFEDRYFENIDGYNRLLLSKALYERFERYEYALIAQPDTFVFRDELDYWCKQEYSFIGAPWITDMAGVIGLPLLPLSHRFRLLSPLRKLLDTEYLVGNGGFSLRNIRACRSFINRFQPILDRSFRHPEVLNEDIFWGLLAPKLCRSFRVPRFSTAVRFAFELNPRYCYHRNGDKLPFGCHGWERYDIAFWKPIIESYGYTIDV